MLFNKFTLFEMQKLYEYAFDTEMDKANFRKKIKPIPMTHLGEKQVNVKHRPAKLFSFDKDKFEELVEVENITFRM